MDQLSEDKVSVLLPLVDATNHRPLAKVEWQAGTDSIGLAVMEDVTPGSEIGNNYGPRNNEQCQYIYFPPQILLFSSDSASDDELWLLYP